MLCMKYFLTKQSSAYFTFIDVLFIAATAASSKLRGNSRIIDQLIYSIRAEERQSWRQASKQASKQAAVIHSKSTCINSIFAFNIVVAIVISGQLLFADQCGLMTAAAASRSSFESRARNDSYAAKNSSMSMMARGNLEQQLHQLTVGRNLDIKRSQWPCKMYNDCVL